MPQWLVCSAWRARRPKGFDEADEQLGARHETRDEQVFLKGVRPGTDLTETIEGRHSQRPGEVSIAAAASHTFSGNLEANLAGTRAGRLSSCRADSRLAKREGDAATSPPLIVSRKQRNSGTADGYLFHRSAVPEGCHSLPSATWGRLAGCGNADRTLTRGLSIWSW